MRATTVFSRLLRLQGVWVKKVGFRRDAVVVHVALRRRRLICPHCEYSCRARKDTRPVDSVWRHLDLGTWCFEIRCRRRQIDCPRHGALAEGVPFARPGVGVHARFRVLGRVAGQPHRQGDHQAAVADRLGDGRANRQAGLRRGAGPRSSQQAVRDRNRRGLLKAPAQLPDAGRQPPPRQGRVGMRR